MAADNQEFRVSGPGDDLRGFEAALTLVANLRGFTQVHGYAVRGLRVGGPDRVLAAHAAESPRLVLLCSKFIEHVADVVLLPAPVGMKTAAALAWEWLNTVQRGQQPDIDGSVEPGWLVYLEDWGKVDGEPFGIGVKATWALYGK